MTHTRWRLRPEVPGGFGELTVMDNSTSPPRIDRLHIEIEDWLGDDLLECFPIFMVTERLAEALSRSGLTGFEIGEVTLTKSGLYEDMHPDLPLPNLRWLKVGRGEESDLALGSANCLEASASAFAILQRFSITHCRAEAPSFNADGGAT
jgi:hypothetical protein